MRRRWSTTSKVLLVFAGLSGVTAFVLVRGYQAEVDRLRPAVGEDVPVVTAATAIARASTISADALEVRRIPSVFAPPDRFADVGAVVGRTALTAVDAGEPITEPRLAPPGGPVAAVAPPGTVGFPLRVDVPSSAVRPGDLVDVLATFGGNRPHTETVADSVEVLLVLNGSSIPAQGAQGLDTASTPTLVLAATSDLSERLAYASAFATMSIAVRPASSSAA